MKRALTYTLPILAAFMPIGAAAAVATADLNIRAGPGSNFPLVGMIAAYGNAQVHGCIEGGAWCDVTWEGTRGWAFAAYLSELGDAPVIIYDVNRYWPENYQDRPFYKERDRFVTGGEAVVPGAIAGAVVAGPIGAVVGAVAGATVGAPITPPDPVTSFIMSTPAEPVLLEGELVVGAALPDAVVLREVPNYEYRFATVNEQRVLVEPGSRRVVYIYR